MENLVETVETASSSVLVGDKLCSRPKPGYLQSLSHFVGTVLHENGLHSKAALKWLIQTSDVPKGLLEDYLLPDDKIERLSKLVDQPTEVMEGTTFKFLAQKFGWQLGSVGVGRAIGPGLRSGKSFCPICLLAQPHFVLPWRFKILPGCHVHKCKFLDRCPHCKQFLDLQQIYFGLSCPFCRKDLSACQSEPLAPTLVEVATSVYKDLEYLLLPQGFEKNTLIMYSIGRELSVIGDSKIKTLPQAETELNMKRGAFAGLETVQNGRIFLRCWDYCNYQKTTIKELFERAISAKRLPRTRLSTKELLAKVSAIKVSQLAPDGPITQRRIADTIGVPLHTLADHAQVRQRIKELKVQFEFMSRGRLLAEVDRVYPILAKSNKHVTAKQIADTIGVSLYILCGSEQVRQRIKELKVQFEFMSRGYLLAEVNRVYLILAKSNKHVTAKQIADAIGVTRGILYAHKQVQQRLDELTVKNRWSTEDLLAEVNRVYPILAQLVKRVTQQQIADAIGVSLNILRGSEQVRQRLAEISAENVWSTEDLLAEVNRVYSVFTKAHKPMTQRQIADAIGVTRGTLYAHKQVRQRLAEIAAQGR